VTLEGLYPGLIGLLVHLEANDNPVVGSALIERGIADALDQHVDSMAVTPEPFARLTQHTDAAASDTGLDRGLSPRSTNAYRGDR
jgi:hypothetical protein